MTDKITLDQAVTDGDILWNILAAILVYAMQLGFAMLEMGYVDAKHYGSVLNKNVTDLVVAALAWYAFGWGLTGFGTEDDNEWFAIPKPGNPNAKDYSFWFFQLSFAACAATIIAGAVAGRTKMAAYAFVSLYVTGFVYPVVVHWAWDSDGFLYKLGYLDFAGSGVVHMVGGILSLIGAYAVGPRQKGHRPSFIDHALIGGGGLILFIGWFGFNAGSVGAFYGSMELSAHCVVTTCLGAAGGFAVQTLINIISQGGTFDSAYVDVSVASGFLAGLVAVTAGTDRLAPEWAIGIGGIGAAIAYGANIAVEKAGIDDPVGAVGVHGAAGFWGVLILSIAPAYSDNKYDWGTNFKGQLVGLLLIVTWTTINGVILFGLLKYTIGLRTDDEEEEELSVPAKAVAAAIVAAAMAAKNEDAVADKPKNEDAVADKPEPAIAVEGDE